MPKPKAAIFLGLVSHRKTVFFLLCLDKSKDNLWKKHITNWKTNWKTSRHITKQQDTGMWWMWGQHCAVSAVQSVENLRRSDHCRCDFQHHPHFWKFHHSDHICVCAVSAVQSVGNLRGVCLACCKNLCSPDVSVHQTYNPLAHHQSTNLNCHVNTFFAEPQKIFTFSKNSYYILRVQIFLLLSNQM